MTSIVPPSALDQRADVWPFFFVVDNVSAFTAIVVRKPSTVNTSNRRVDTGSLHRLEKIQRFHQIAAFERRATWLGLHQAPKCPLAYGLLWQL